MQIETILRIAGLLQMKLVHSFFIKKKKERKKEKSKKEGNKVQERKTIDVREKPKLCTLNLSPWNGSKHWTPHVHKLLYLESNDRQEHCSGNEEIKVSLLQARPAKNTKMELYFYFSCYSTDQLFGYQITGWVWFSRTSAFHELNRKSNNRLFLLLVGFRYSSS